MDALTSQRGIQPPVNSWKCADTPARDPGGQDSQDQAPPDDTFHARTHFMDDLDEVEEFREGERQQRELEERHSAWGCLESAQRLAGILERLLPLSRRPEVDYDFHLLDSRAPFASSCSHGRVYFSRGLLQHLDLGSVTYFAAHEMAHTELRHYASRGRRLEELRRAIPAPPGTIARQRFEMAAVLAVRHMEEFDADHHAATWLDFASAQQALAQLHDCCRQLSPQALQRPTHPSFEGRLSRLEQALAPPDPIDYLWSLVGS